ncbi:MAG: T9SS type A sorting domain-containing protein [Bacteroidia bacterium]
MKKVLLTLSFTTLVLFSSKAQFDMFDVIKEANVRPTLKEFELIAEGGGIATGDTLVGSTWTPKEKTHYVKDDKGNVVDVSRYEWDGSKWVATFSGIQQLTYNSNNKVSTSRLFFDMGSGESFVRISNYQVDGNGNYTKVTGVDSVNGMAIGFVDSLIYNSSNKLIERIFSRIFMGMSAPESRYVYTYNSGGKPIQVIHYSYSSGWEEEDRTTLTYNSGGNVESIKEESYDNSSNTWENSELDSFYYSGNNMITYVEYEYDGTNWEAVNRNSYSYNSSNQLVEMINYDFDGTNWLNDKKGEIIYENNKPKELRMYNWLGSSWETTHRERIMFSSPVMGIKRLAQSNEVSVYPNPAKSNIYVNIPESKNAQFEIFDINGASVLNGKMNSNEININGLNAGIYFVVVNSNNAVYKTRFVKE